VRFLVDGQLPPSLAEWLRATGGEAVHVEEAGLRNAIDSAIREYAVNQSYALITKDKDFRALGIASAAVPGRLDSNRQRPQSRADRAIGRGLTAHPRPSRRRRAHRRTAVTCRGFA
jgi:Domain of unknown function (DUF5615)